MVILSVVGPTRAIGWTQSSTGARTKSIPIDQIRSRIRSKPIASVV
jgi:hypothetical protein